MRNYNTAAGAKVDYNAAPGAKTAEQTLRAVPAGRLNQEADRIACISSVLYDHIRAIECLTERLYGCSPGGEEAGAPECQPSGAIASLSERIDTFGQLADQLGRAVAVISDVA